MKRILCVALTSLFIVACGFGNPADGEKVGTIIAVRKSGILCKTWEITLIRGGLTDGSGAFSVQPYHGTIEDDTLAATAQEAMRSNSEVRLTYRDEGVYGFCRTDSGGSFVKTIETVR